MQLTEALAKAIELLPDTAQAELVRLLESQVKDLANHAVELETQSGAIQAALAELRNGDTDVFTGLAHEDAKYPSLHTETHLNDRRGVTKHEGLYTKVRRINKHHKAAGPRLPKPSRLDIMAWAKAHDGITVHEFVAANEGKFDMSKSYVSVTCSGCAHGGLLRRGGPGQYVITTKGKEWQ